MKEYLKALWNLDTFSAIYGWLFFSFFVYLGQGFLFSIIGSDYFRESSEEIRIIMSLLIGYCFWYPYWDKRKR